MDSILNKLTEIESAAAAIVDHAEAQKEVLDREYHDKRIKFDEDLEEKTSAEIQKIRSDMEERIMAVLDSQSGNHDDALVKLEQEYEQKHTQYAQDILKRITEV